jgi:hypothetical protein
MAGLLLGVGDVEHRQPAMTSRPQANLQNLPHVTSETLLARTYRHLDLNA